LIRRPLLAAIAWLGDFLDYPAVPELVGKIRSKKLGSTGRRQTDCSNDSTGFENEAARLAANVEADMSRMSKVGVLKNIPAIVTMLSLAAAGGVALGAQDRSTLKLGKLSFADFKGYEDWRDVAVSQTETQLKVILANDVMMKAFRQGLPADGKLFPEGSKIVKIEWSFKKNPASPYFVQVPDTLKAVDVIEKDTKRFPDTHGWAYGDFNYDAASDTFTPQGTDSNCGYACHTTVAAKDYIFTAYPKR
jgi:Cytochrome P460